MPASDFEDLANQIVKINFKNSEIHGFSEGRDGGIDGIDDIKKPQIIVQAKRLNSSQSKVVTTIKEEIDKIKELASKNHYSNLQYVIVTCANLSTANQKKIRDHAKNLMSSDRNIIDGKRLKEFSLQAEYYKIFCNYKLVETDFVGQIAENKRKEIEKESKDFFSSFDSEYFVETEIFKKAYKTLLKEKVILLHGNPGVGKSTTSKMLAKKMFNRPNNKCAIIRRDIDDCKDTISKYNKYYRDNADIELVVVFDDFLGRNSADATDREIKKVIEICSLAKSTAGLYIILNCRTQIVNETKQESSEFTSFLERKKSGINTSIVIIDISEVTITEKALILRKNFELVYNHITTKNDKETFENYYDELRDPCHYNPIIYSKNWNPRVIGEITRSWDEAPITQKRSFFDYVISILNNPQKLYEELFEKLSNEEKDYLLNLIFFSSYPVDREIVRDSFINNKLSVREDIEVIERKLNESWIKFILDYNPNRQKIDFINPSINDYLQGKEVNTPSFRGKIQKNTLFLKQIPKLLGTKKLYELIQKDVNKFKDSDEFIGEQLIILLDNSECNFDKERFKKLLPVLKGNFYNSKNNDSKKTGNWLSILEKIDNANKEIKEIFFEELMFSINSKTIIDNILRASGDSTDALANTLDYIIYDVTGMGLAQNEIIDFGEEETGVNLFEECIAVKLQDLQDYLDDSTTIFDFSEETLDLVEDTSEIEESVENLVEKVKKEIEDDLKYALFSGFSEISMDDLDFDNLRQTAEDYISDYILVFEDDEDFDRDFSTNNSIDSIINKPLS